MTTSRLEAFSDGVIAIIITIMVLALKTPTSPSVAAIQEVGPALIGYLLSFAVVAIMWVNHHHMMHAVRRVDPGLLWLNMNLLFWMSLIPFATAYLGEHPMEPWPVALYGIILGLGALSFALLRTWVAGQYRDDPTIRSRHLKLRQKSLITATIYFVAAALATVTTYLSFAVFISMPLLYLIPDRETIEAR